MAVVAGDHVFLPPFKEIRLNSSLCFGFYFILSFTGFVFWIDTPQNNLRHLQQQEVVLICFRYLTNCDDFGTKRDICLSNQKGPSPTGYQPGSLSTAER